MVQRFEGAGEFKVVPPTIDEAIVERLVAKEEPMTTEEILTVEEEPTFSKGGYPYSRGGDLYNDGGACT